MKIRSPCLTAALALGAAASIRPVPPGMTLLQESAPAAPPRVTPELLRERGVTDGQTNTGVSLHERAVHLGKIQTLEAADESDQVPFKANIAVCDIINLNWRFYPRSAYEGAITRAEADMKVGKLTALVEHPGWDDGWKGRLNSIGARWTKLSIEDMDIEWPPGSGTVARHAVVVGEGLYTRSESGQLIQQLIADGVFVGISTNGYSSVRWKRFGDLGIDDPTGLLDPEMEIAVTGDDLTLLTIDFVAMPANAVGQVTAESGGFAPPPTRPQPAPQPAPTPSPAPAPAQETTVKLHPKITALTTRLGKSLEQVKADHPAEYQAVLEEIATETETTATEAAKVPGLQAQVSSLTTERDNANQALQTERANGVRESRTRMVDDAITAAKLPTLPPYQEGATSIDLAKQWRDQLVEAAATAPSNEAAQGIVAQQVSVRQHMLGARTTESAGNPTPTGPGLPAGDNDNPTQRTTESATPLLGNALIQGLRG
ncbi:hypothetical protein [Deinococcus radiotolerans]|uniref:Uncharacterized protein n=1 Tax=Deinococcus radiotolerans TaxID=1309407 RepID=A0ABQ2FQZ8_9DEIO|nr:hypothetical protein [Deinococcus radiotolerans]GGL18412.1 hypothetical protein GCM10010844_41550 [Deinococcus radiotolerans]